mgnify:CR=1 FL=1
MKCKKCGSAIKPSQSFCSRKCSNLFNKDCPKNKNEALKFKAGLKKLAKPQGQYLRATLKPFYSKWLTEKGIKVQDFGSILLGK